jgi:hypothetical protein
MINVIETINQIKGNLADAKLLIATINELQDSIADKEFESNQSELIELERSSLYHCKELLAKIQNDTDELHIEDNSIEGKTFKPSKVMTKG